jgi:ABC-2 type transport system permease protein
MLASLYVEFSKLNRSLAALLAVAAPGLIAVFLFFNMLRGDKPPPWDQLMMSASAIWAFFMLPMSVTALTALVAHMEHGPRSWDHLRALPVPRWRHYGAKAVVVLSVVVLMSLAVLAFSAGAAMLAGLVKPAVAPGGAFEAVAYARLLGQMFLAALLLIAVQLWVALRFSSFVPALAVGIGGTFFAVVATSARIGVFLPWQMPVNMLATDAWRMQTALGLGAVGGAVVFGLMLIHLTRRETL